jgi:hypothetical protein
LTTGDTSVAATFTQMPFPRKDLRGVVERITYQWAKPRWSPHADVPISSRPIPRCPEMPCGARAAVGAG